MAELIDFARPPEALAQAPVVTLATVMVRDLTVQADIGCNMDEVGRRQPLILEVKLTVEPPAEDRLGATIDYRDVVRLAEGLAAERIELIETFARRLAAACLEHGAVVEADVTIAKPRALPNALAMTRAVLRRS